MTCPKCDWFEGRVWHLEDNVIALVNALHDIGVGVAGVETWARRTILSKIEEGDAIPNLQRELIKREIEKLFTIRYVPRWDADGSGRLVYSVEMRDARTAPSVDEVVEAIIAIFDED